MGHSITSMDAMIRWEQQLVPRQRVLCIVILGCLGAGLLALTTRLFQINTAMAPKLRAQIERQQRGRAIIPARRGLIFDRRGRIVAGSRQVWSVFADPAEIERALADGGRSVSELASTIAPILQVDAGMLEDRIRHSRSHRFCWLKRRVGDVEANAIRQIKARGIGLQADSLRTYPMGPRMAQVVGVVGIDGDGLEGLEKHYDQHLHGRSGMRCTIRDARRRTIAGRVTGSFGPQDGGHLVLTIDSLIQGFAEEQLANQVDQFEAESGVAVVMNPRTGEVLAVACVPTFDPNDYASSPPQRRRNRAITDPVEPGSAFKPFVASGALLHGAATVEEEIYCHDGLCKFGGRLVHDTHPRGNLSVAGIVIHSSNIGMGILGQRLGNKRLHEIVRRFGFGERTNVDFPGESSGIVPPLRQWTSYSTTSIPFGQEIAVTPLQLAAGFGAIVNDGVLLRPRLVRALLSAEGEVVETFDEVVAVRRVLPEGLAHYMTREVLTEVVNRSSGRRAAVRGYQVLGKTGTAQVPYRDRRGYEPDAYLSTFVGAAPAEDPQVIALVMIRKPNPQLGYYGSVVSAPAVGEILRCTLAYLNIPPHDSVLAGL